MMRIRRAQTVSCNQAQNDLLQALSRKITIFKQYNQQLKSSPILLDTTEYGGPQGKEPTRYGDWEKNGRVSDF
jgi:hypothetical protein